MSRKWLIVLILVAVVVALVVIKTNQPWPEIAETRVDDSQAKFITKEDAIQAVKDGYPELNAYPSNNLPPTSISDLELDAGGWGLVFAQNGSGLPGILKAQCFTVSDASVVTPTGTFTRSGSQVVNIVDPLTCTAIVEL